MDQGFWDEMYGAGEAVWSGRPNGVLVAEVASLTPGRALDVGCGEGADALWLARLGWQVTAIDISPVALDRARAVDSSLVTSAPAVTWQQLDLSAVGPPVEAFDLVSAQYFSMLRQSDHCALRRLLAAVAPGGTLLMVGHDLTDHQGPGPHGVDLRDLYEPSEVGSLLDASWTVLVDETRPRPAPVPQDSHHVRDTVLRAHKAA